MFAGFLAILLSGVFSADAPAAADASAIPPRIEKFLQLCETSRRGAILQLEHQLRGLRAQGANSKPSAGRVAKLEAELDTLRANQQPVVPALRFPPEVGDIGRLPRLSCHVDQILSDDQMLVRCLFSIKVTAVARFQPRYETVVRGVTFLVRGLSTRETHEGTDLELLDVFEVTGTHTYQSQSGRPITVRVIAPFDMKAIEPYFKAVARRP